MRSATVSLTKYISENKSQKTAKEISATSDNINVSHGEAKMHIQYGSKLKKLDYK
jgi:hypothetical protein